MNPLQYPATPGQRFGILTVLEKLDNGNVRVACDCGARLTVSSMRELVDPVRGRVSCGCHKKLKGS